MIKFKDILASNEISAVCTIYPTLHSDSRGLTYTLFHNDLHIGSTKIDPNFVEDKIISGREGAWRGLHGDEETWKLFYCVHGKVMLYLADMRPNSSSFLKTEWYLLDVTNPLGILVPPGVVNGHLGLEDYTLLYKWSEIYNGPHNQITVKYNDPRLKWRQPLWDRIKYISDRDKP